MEPTSLSMAFVEAYDQRDAEASRPMLDADVAYLRPGPRPPEGEDAIMAQHHEDWHTYDATIEVRRAIKADDSLAVELTLASGQGRIAVEAVVILRWVEDRMVEYRLYLDSVPG